MADAVAEAGRRARARGRRLDRRDRRAAWTWSAVVGRRSARGRGALRGRRSALLRGDHDHRPLAQARQPRGVARGRPRAALRPGEGRRDDLAELRHDALLRRRRTRWSTPATLDRLLRAAVERSFERMSVDGQLSTNDSVFAIAGGASGVAVEPGSDDERAFAAALDALLRQLAVEMVADGEGAERVARLVVRGAVGGGGPGRARGRQLAAGEVRAARAATRTGAGSSQAAGQAVPDADLVPARALHRGRAGGERRRRRGARRTTGGARLDEAMARRRGGDAARPRSAPARRPRSSSATSAPSTCGSTRSTRREQRSCTARQGPRIEMLLESLPYIREFSGTHDRDQVRRRGDGRGEAARGVRHRRRAAQVRRHEPGDRARRRPGDHRLHAAARASRWSSSRGCACRTSRRSRSRRWC